MVRSSALVLGCLLAAPLPALVINEIMYHAREETAPGAEDKGFEWIELYNETGDPLDLSGYAFAKGIDFVFLPGTFLAPRSFLVVCANQAAVRAKYGITCTAGDWGPLTALANEGETIALANPAGNIEAEVEYNDRNRWPAGADGSGHSLALRSPFLDIQDADSWAPSPTLGGSPGAPNFGGEPRYEDTVLVDDQDAWSYLKGSAPPLPDWNQPGFDDSGWSSGPAGIGYGTDEAGLNTRLDDMKNGYLTVFCRKTISIPDPSKIDRLILSIIYDDGFYMYVNGADADSRNVSSKAWDAKADKVVEYVREDIDLSDHKDLLGPGDNVIAFQAHNVDTSSSDLVFIPRLLSRRLILPTEDRPVPVVINEALLRTSGERWVELYNYSDATVDISGYHMTDDRRELVRATLPAGTVIGPRGRLAFTDGELGLNFSLTTPASRSRVFVALVDPPGTRIVDAFTFKPAVDGRSEARVPDGDKEMAPSAPPTRGEPNRALLPGGGDIVINEIMYHPLSEDVDFQYIELFNRGAAAVDLAGFRLAKAVDFAFPAVVMAAGEYLVVARSPERIVRMYGLRPELVAGPWYEARQDDEGDEVREPKALGFRDDRIVLLDPLGNIANAVHYADGGEWPSWADGGGSSLELIDPFQENDCGQSWDASDDSKKARPATFAYTARSPAAVDPEFQILLLAKGIAVVDRVSVKKGGQEFIPNGTFETTADPWKILGTHVRSGRTADPDLVLDGSGSLKVVATGKGDPKPNHIETDLSSPLDTTSQYTVSFQARWIVGARAIHTRGYNHGLARTSFLDVPESLGTPGAPNSVSLRQAALAGQANIGPVIDKVVHLPVVPEAGEGVTVKARIRDADGIRPGSAMLYYAIDTPAAADGFTAVPMDGPDADDLYRGGIPGKALGTRVLFCIAAEDDSPLRLPGRFPVDRTARTHPLLLDPALAGTGDRDYAMYRHDVRYPSTPYLSYRFVLHDGNADYLYDRLPLSNDYIEGTLVTGAEKAYYHTRIRWAGSPWLRGRSWANSYRVRFSGDDLLNGSTKRVDLENHSTDGRERISNYLLRSSNTPGVKVPYSRQRYVRWQVNDWSGVMEEVERPSKDFISLWFPDDDRGDFFKMDDRFEFNDSGNRVSNQDARLTYPPWPNAAYANDDPENAYVSWKENYRWFFTPQAHENDDDWTNLIQLSRIMDPVQTQDGDFDVAIPYTFDLESVLRVWAVRMNTDDWDTWGTTRGKNAYLYYRPSDCLWMLLPWDMELTYSGLNSFPPVRDVNAQIFPEVWRLFSRPAVLRRYYGILKEMVDRQFGSAFLNPWMDMLEASGTDWTGVGRPGGFIDQRAAAIHAKIDAYTYPSQRLVVTTNSGKSFTTGVPEVDLEGKAPVEVYRLFILRNGEFLDPQPEVQFSGTSITGWSVAAVPLVHGKNTIQFYGFPAMSDAMIDSTSIEIECTAAFPLTLVALDPPVAAEGDVIRLRGTGFSPGLRALFGSVDAGVADCNPGEPTRAATRVPETMAAGVVNVKVRNPDGQASNALPLEVRRRFLRGDANGDGAVDMADAVKVIFVLFAANPTDCRDALDFNDDAVIRIGDAIGLLTWLFQKGAPPAAPFPEVGIDPAGPSLGCERGG